VTEDLAQMSCEKCRVGTPKMTYEEIAVQRKQIPGWRLATYDDIDAGIRFFQLLREYEFDNFSTALAFTNALAALAEREGHYPSLVTEWGNVTVHWCTRPIGGLHRNDFIMAAKTDVAYDEFVSKQGPQQGLVEVIRDVYPSLVKIAQQQACRFDTPKLLKLIIWQVMSAPNVSAARKILESGPEL